MSDMLDEKATQTSFAELVGVSKQAIQKKAQRIGLSPSGTHREWVRTYCAHLIAEAAGRGGSDQNNLTKQRIAESQQKTLALALANEKELSHLVIAEDLASALDELARSMRVNIIGSSEKIINEIESKYSITLDDELVHQPLRDAAERIVNVGRKLSEGLRSRS